jgi:hydroxymethylbilane synthase
MSTPEKWIIGTRGSDLALWQARWVQSLLASAGFLTELKIIKTAGDQIQHLSFEKMEGKGFFTKEIEAALASREIDIAVHSCKDLETTDAPGLIIAAIPERADPRDVLLLHPTFKDGINWRNLPSNAIIGTSSARRKCQISQLIPTCTIKDLRGNVPTRVDKLRRGEYDAIILAQAGLQRLQLDLNDLTAIPLEASEFVPAAAQGALAIQCRKNDTTLFSVLENLSHQPSLEAVQTERRLLRAMGGGCQVPAGIHCQFANGTWKIFLSIAKSWSDQPWRHQAEGVDLNQIALEIEHEIARRN